MSAATRVPSYGPTDAKIAIVGEAPREDEIRKGRPFIGASGNLLGVMLSDAGIDITECRLLNVCETRPPGNKFDKYFYTDGRPSKELLRERERLTQELLDLKPNVTLLLGNESLKALTTKSGINKWRGSILSVQTGKVVCSYHPAYILRDYDVRPIAQFDMRRLAAESKYPHVIKPNITLHTEPTLDQVLGFFSRKPDICTFDIETIGRSIRCVGFSTDGKEALCVPFRRLNMKVDTNKIQMIHTPSDNPHYWSEEDEIKVITAMNKFFARTQTRFVAQNFSFDGPLMEMEFGTRIANYWMDTLHAQHCAYLELPASLDFLTSIYTRLGYYADYNAGSDYETWRYNCMDVIATYQCISPILQTLQELGQREFYFKHVHPLSKALTRVGCNGVLIDVENRKALAQPIEDELKSRLETLKKRFGRDVNPRSPVQVKEIIRDNLKRKVPTRGGKETTDARALDELRSRYPDESFFTDVIEYRERGKFLSTYVEATLDDDHRMRTSYNPSGTNTGRISSSQTIWKTGGNLQNIPKSEFRRLFTVGEGNVFIHADLSQAEARVVAWLALDKELVGRWTDDPFFDVHSYKASQLYNKPLTEILTDERSKAKACNHSGNYGIAWKKFSYISGIPQVEARRLLEKHQSNFHLQAWWADVRTRLESTRTLATPFGRKRIFYGRLDEETFRKAYAFVPQSTVGDIVNRAVIQCDELLDPTRCQTILQVHDEIDLECEAGYAPTAIGILRESLEFPLYIDDSLPPLIIPVEISSGPNWWDQKEVK
ncbi:MAG: putative DNA polymerase [Prokaryotic dsDNA virus sp.]|nr:MAG: putative DNA polymerase [Prokaryotic dsDNA virus sp.]|tara:strand:- start:1247 stop:3568 length:2322 start_codon:yes stop_codon:yes gene_type:complete